MTRVGRVKPAFVHRNPQLGCSPAFPSKSINSDLIKWGNYFQELKNIQSVLRRTDSDTLSSIYVLLCNFILNILANTFTQYMFIF